VATVKPWNIKLAAAFAKKSADPMRIISRYDELTYQKINHVDPELIFFPHWSWKIPEAIYKKWECIAFHMTDLPFGRGGSPLQNLISRGIYKTKISAFRVTGDYDAGPVYLKADLRLKGTAQEIFTRAAEIIFNEMIPHIIKKRPVPQPQRGPVKYFKRRQPSESDISKIKGLASIYDHIRMLDADGYPSAFLESGGARYEFSGAEMVGNMVKARVKIKMMVADGEVDKS